MSNKTRINTTFDKDLWYLLGLKYGSRRVEVLENLARELLFASNSIDELREEIIDEELRLSAKKKVLKEMVNIQKINDSNRDLINKAMNTIKKILKNQGSVIGENQIDGVANINGLSKDNLMNEVKRLSDIQIEKFYEPPKI